MLNTCITDVNLLLFLYFLFSKGSSKKEKKEVKQLRWRRQNIHVPSSMKYGSFWKGLESVKVSETKFLELFTQVEQIKKTVSP